MYLFPTFAAMLQKMKRRIVSLLLILVFSQKLGLELWVHHWLHESVVPQSVASAEKGKPNLRQLPVKCNCVEDSLIPLIESEIPIYSCTRPHLIAIFLPAYSSCLSGDVEFSSLRGPPAASFHI
jgi:hypothetical protein